jgi:quinoprotein glucose dehydrogenase
MPAFNHLPEDRQNAIINFIFGLETNDTPEQFDFTIPVSKIKEKEISGEEKPSLSYFCSSCDLVPYTFRGFQRFNDNEGYPAIKPPWGTLNAVDLNTGTIKWTVPLGEYKELTKPVYLSLELKIMAGQS